MPVMPAIVGGRCKAVKAALPVCAVCAASLRSVWSASELAGSRGSSHLERRPSSLGLHHGWCVYSKLGKPLQSNFDTFIVNQEGGDSFQTRKLELNVFKDKASKFNWDSDVMKKLLQMWINMPIFLQTDKVRFMAIDLLLLRPCIEHYMLAVIMGRGGGPEELGATFWGQTEISCYDDSQHGIWGMSYKYHERAIVLNERNLIRVFDVCFDGYCGNDSHILEWNVDKVQRFRDKLTNVTDQYDGPNFIVMGLPPGQSGKMFPNPLVLQSKSVNGAALGTCCPDRSLPANDVHKYQYFKGEDIQVQIYDKYLRFTGLHELPNNALHSFENANETGSGNLTSF
jgi:hypothetical protein